MATDSADNFYVATDVEVGSGSTNRAYEGIAIYPAGTTAPTRFIAGDATGILNPTQIAVDAAGNIYVASTGIEAAGAIQVFGATATGNASPIRTITGADTTIYNTRGIAVDAAGNVYVSTISLAPANGPYLAGTPSIVEFSATADGNVAPMNVITGSSANIATIGNLRVDSAGNIFAIGGPGVVKFSTSSTGNVAPAAVITSASVTAGIGGPSIALQ